MRRLRIERRQVDHRPIASSSASIWPMSGRSFGDKDDTGQRGADDTGEKGGHPDHGKSFRLDVQIRKYELAELPEEQSQLGAQYEHGETAPPVSRPHRIWRRARA